MVAFFDRLKHVSSPTSTKSNGRGMNCVYKIALLRWIRTTRVGFCLHPGFLEEAMRKTSFVVTFIPAPEEGLRENVAFCNRSGSLAQNRYYFGEQEIKNVIVCVSSFQKIIAHAASVSLENRVALRGQRASSPIAIIAYDSYNIDTPLCYFQFFKF